MTRARSVDGPTLVGRRRDTPEIEALLEAFVLDKLRVGHPTRRSLDTYEMHLRAFLRHRNTVAGGVLNLADVVQRDVEDYVVAERARGLATSTLTTKLMAARSLFGWLIDTGQHPGPNPATGVRPPRSTTRPRDPYRPEDANTLVVIAWSKRDDLRWLVAAHIASLGFATGLRPAELAGLKLSDVDLERRRLAVFGKGAKHRSVVLGDDAVVLLQRYLSDVRPGLVASDYLFVNPTSEPGKEWVGRYRPQSFADHFKKLGRLSGLPGVHHPHRLRHTYATDMLRRGLDVTVLQHQLGHAKVTTTMTYLHLLDDDVENAVRVAHGHAPRTLPPPIDILPEHYRSTTPEGATRADGATADDSPAEPSGSGERGPSAGTSPAHDASPPHHADPRAAGYAIAAVVSDSPVGLDAVPEELCAQVTDALVDLDAGYMGSAFAAPDATDRITALVAQAGSILRDHAQDQDDTAIMGMVAAVGGRAGDAHLPSAASGAAARKTLVTAWAVARAAANPASPSAQPET